MDRYSFYRYIVSMIYPNRCGNCNEIIPYNHYFCNNCSTPFSRANTRDIITCCEYKSDTKSLILNSKNEKNGYAIAACGKLLYDRLEEDNILKDIDVITYIPTRKSRIKEKGYCFPKLLAKDIAKLSNKELLKILKVKDYETSQKELNRIERKENLKDVFYFNNCRIDKKSRILLIDDVTTTGSTLYEARKTLINNGIEYVTLAAFAKSAIQPKESKN